MFTLLNPHSEHPVLLLCEHASNAVPEEFGDLGLGDPSILSGHHGFDPPMKRVTELLAEKIGATAVMGNYTRLLIDLNRRLDDPDLIAEHYFGYDIPANCKMSDAERKARIQRYYMPYHEQVNLQIERLQKTGKTPFIFSLHSFTENPGEGHDPRPWDIGLLYNEYDIAANHFDVYLTEHHPEMNVGHNEPYDLRLIKTSSVITHGEQNNLPYLLIELKNENFDRGTHTHEQWADILAETINGLGLDIHNRAA